MNPAKKSARKAKKATAKRKSSPRKKRRFVQANRMAWNEIKARAAKFAEEWKDAGYERGETQLFYRSFFKIFGTSVNRVASFEERVKRLGDKSGLIDLFWPGVLLVEQKSAGRNLDNAKEQAFNYLTGLPEYEFPRYLLLSDFQTFRLFDLEEDVEHAFALHDLPSHVEKFGFIFGIEKRSFKDQDPVNIVASELIGKIYDALKADGALTDTHLEKFLVRLVFCLFADDTGIFEPRGHFLDYIENRTSPDGSDLGEKLTHLFQTLNRPINERSDKLDEDLQKFAYINGDLFDGGLEIPSFNSSMRKLLLDACEFDWAKISPAIFGSLFQSVMDAKKRRAIGAHYTTEKNILKVINSLFMDEFREEFSRLKALKSGKRKRLEEFRDRLASMKFLDPACGCGNFLIIAYRELRLLEIEIIAEMRIGAAKQYELDLKDISKINVHQFYGIELEEFPAQIAETALWMMDHIMNIELSLKLGKLMARIPIEGAPNIRHGDALEFDWNEVLPAKQCNYIFGNPPFVGSKLQSPEQREQVKRIAKLGGSGGTLDYVTAWFILAGEYIKRDDTKIGFVATNSITQGEQVGQLWPILFNRAKLEILFAHRSFEWGSDNVRGVAHVHVVIIGLNRKGAHKGERYLYEYPDAKEDPVQKLHKCISPYLVDASNFTNPEIVVIEEDEPLNSLPRMQIGSKPIDDGNLIFDKSEKDMFLGKEPLAMKFLRPYIGTKEFLNNEIRWILALHNASPTEIASMPLVQEKLAKVSEFRLQSRSESTRDLANYPERYHVNVIPTRPFMVLGEINSKDREYIPIGWLEPPVIPSNLVKIVADAELWQFSLLNSAMHMAWIRVVGGRLGDSIRYSSDVVYNTFPIPNLTDKQKKNLAKFGQAILDARKQYPDETLKTLYGPATMPAPLKQAHQKLNVVVDKIYRRTPFADEIDRISHLLNLYDKMVNNLPMFERKKRR